MKIGILIGSLGGGGAERVCVELARQFVRMGHEVEFVLIHARGELLEEVQSEFPVVELDAPRFRHIFPALIRYLKKAKIDSLLVALWPLTAFAPIAAKVAQFKGTVVISQHGITYSPQRQRRASMHFLMRRLGCIVAYRLATARVGVSDGICEEMSWLSSMPRSKMITIHNPVRAFSEPSTDALAESEVQWGAPHGRRILTVGRLVKVKNHSMLFRAFAQMNDMSTRLMVVGQGADEEALRALAAELGIADQVIFLGFQNDLAPFYATADLFVLSSNKEGFANVVAEALSFGLPVVSTDCPSGPADILEDGRWGYLVPVGDVDALARAMADALAAPVDADAQRRRAADFSPERAANAYLAAMQSR